MSDDPIWTALGAVLVKCARDEVLTDAEKAVLVRAQALDVERYLAMSVSAHSEVWAHVFQMMGVTKEDEAVLGDYFNTPEGAQELRRELQGAFAEEPSLAGISESLADSFTGHYPTPLLAEKSH